MIHAKPRPLKYKQQLVLDVIGWYGMSAVLLAYGLVSLSILPGNSIVCILLNLTGSTGLVVAALVKRADQLVALNIVWAIVALVALGRLLIV